MKREFAILLGGWLALAAFIFGIGWQNLSSPGLFYDEAIYGGLAKDFVTGQTPGGHMPGVSTTEIFGAPFPVFVQPYIGALKCWLLIPAFKIFGPTLAVLRASNLFFSTTALLIFMLWAWRLLGLAEALLAGLLLALDPAFFFIGVLDWGSLLPSLLCRFAGFFLVLSRVAAAIGALGVGRSQFRSSAWASSTKLISAFCLRAPLLFLAAACVWGKSIVTLRAAAIQNHFVGGAGIS